MFWSFYATFVWNIYRTKKNWARCDQKCVLVFMYSSSLLLSDCNEWNWTNVHRFSKNTKISDSMKSRPVGAEFVADRQTDRQTGRSDEANSRFLQFCVHTKKKTCFLPRMALTVVCKARLIAAYIRYTGCSWNWRQTETLWTWASIRWGHLVCGKKNYLGDGIQCCRF